VNAYFCACEGKGGGDEDAAEAFEAVGEGAGVSPVAAANVSSWCGALACHEHDPKDVESNDRDDLDNRKHKLHFTIPLDAEDVYNDNDLPQMSMTTRRHLNNPTYHKKNNHKRIPVNRIIPELYRNRRRHNLQRQSYQPLERIVITHGHPPGRVYKPRRECGETARHWE